MAVRKIIFEQLRFGRFIYSEGHNILGQNKHTIQSFSYYPLQLISKTIKYKFIAILLRLVTLRSLVTLNNVMDCKLAGMAIVYLIATVFVLYFQDLFIQFYDEAIKQIVYVNPVYYPTRILTLWLYELVSFIQNIWINTVEPTTQIAIKY